jgi:hypothetical protein
MVTQRLGQVAVNPALVELRQQRLLLGRLVAALRVPIGDQSPDVPTVARPQRRTVRGFYQVGRAS